MKKLAVASLVLLLAGQGCVEQPEPASEPVPEPVVQPSEPEPSPPVPEPLVLSPLDPNGVVFYLPTYKRFGEYFDDRFRGYHTGEDSEVPPEDLGPGEVQLVPIRAIAAGEVMYWSNVSGYGGVIIVKHEVDGRTVSALYGHLDLDSSTLKTGDKITKGQFLANLGADKSEDTDGERQHLHFALWEGTEVKLAGYVNTPAELDAWINPWDFLKQYSHWTEYDPNDDPEVDWDWLAAANLIYPEPLPIDHPAGRTAYQELEFSLPRGWDVEYVPSIDALNVYDASGSGSARERSQIFIRYFDANDFLTLSTVNVLSEESRWVGGTEGIYLAKRYEIEKRSGVPDFQDQPAWRNVRHIVTDVRAEEGFSRFYVIAKNPELDDETYELFLKLFLIEE
jgi:murein DD-endopeptidase MepM/ murein hydrolase activator NlpD